MELENIKAEELAIDLGYSYLEGGYGRWTDGYGTTKQIRDLEKQHLENCINFVDRGIQEIECGDVDIEIIKKLKEKEIYISKEDIEIHKKRMIEILRNKKRELEEYR